MKRKRIDIIISLLLAIALWVYVVGEMDPTMRQTFHGVTIQYANEATMHDIGLGVASYGEQELSVTVTGARSRITALQATDIQAVVDLSEAAKGTNQLTIRVSLPSGLEVYRQSLDQVTVVADDFVAEKKDVKISYLGEYAKDTEPTTIAIDPESVNVSGAASLVEKVSYVRGRVENLNSGGTESTVATRLVAVDANGKEVENVQLSQDTANVTCALYRTKSVALTVPITDNSTDANERETEIPDTITIKGTRQTLEGIDSVEAEPIDITTIMENSSIEIKPILPEGVLLADSSSGLKMKVTVTDASSTKVLTFDEDDIVIEGLGDNLAAALSTKEVTVTFTGTEEQTKALSKDNVSLSIGLANLEVGTHTVPVTIETKRKYKTASADPASVVVVITAKTAG